MSHVQQSTLSIDKTREDISDVLNELWRQGVLLRLEPENDAITIHCNTSNQMTVATATILANTPFAVREEDIPEPETDEGEIVTLTAEDVGTMDAASLGFNGAD